MLAIVHWQAVALQDVSVHVPLAATVPCAAASGVRQISLHHEALWRHWRTHMTCDMSLALAGWGAAERERAYATGRHPAPAQPGQA